LKPEWLGSPLAQEEKAPGKRKPVITEHDGDGDDNNNIMNGA
jgi:hypothetical protein